MRMILLIIFGILVSGCSLFPEPEVRTDVVYREKPLIHPPLPRPVSVVYSEPYIITKETIAQYDDNAVFQCFEFDDGQQLAADLEASKAYIRELTAILCSYRKELDESRCEPYNDGEFDNVQGDTDEQKIQNQN